MPNTRTKSYKIRIIIITDQITHCLILNFDDYVIALADIIKNHIRNFRPVFMVNANWQVRTIYDKLKDKNDNNLIILLFCDSMMSLFMTIRGDFKWL